MCDAGEDEHQREPRSYGSRPAVERRHADSTRRPRGDDAPKHHIEYDHGRPSRYRTPVRSRKDLAKIFTACAVLICLLGATDLLAQSIDAPELLPPVAPEVMTRGTDGQAIIRAIKLTSPLHVDGTLDEEVYQREKSFGGFLQVVPKYGAEQSERTEVWVMYDDHNMYVACRCWDS